MRLIIKLRKLQNSQNVRDDYELSEIFERILWTMGLFG